MSSDNFRKLNFEVEVQPTVDQRPFAVAGILIASILLLIFVYAYFYRNTNPQLINKADIVQPAKNK